tara:strand:- start:5341 stop:6459 length:1119 start_codon:yes stop_codon:yes gene_type:complete
MKKNLNLTKTVHLIYPSDLKKNINPWSIGNNISIALKDKYKIKNYYWTSIEKIYPNKGDILIGHCHPNPFTIFRRSIKNKNWKKKIIIQPYNEDPKQMSHLYDVVKECDNFLAICGEYWYKRISKSKFKSWKKKITQIDLGLDVKLYPKIKKKFNKINERKFLYIGNDYSYNNYAKNLIYLKKITQLIGENKFASIGNKSIGKVKHYGWLNLQNKKSLNLIKNYDFLIQTSNYDANPSTVLESLSWGLIPVITPQCGYKKEKSIINIPLNKTYMAFNIINKLQKMSNKKLKKLQSENWKILKKFYNWVKFRNTIRKIVFSRNKNKKIFYTKKELVFFKKNYLASPNYHLNFDMILPIIKSNIKIFIKRMIKL